MYIVVAVYCSYMVWKNSGWFGQPKWAPNFEFTKFEFTMKFQFLSSSLLFGIVQTESANHTESTGDAKEKLVRSYELEFAPNLEFTLVDPIYFITNFVH